MPWYQSISDWLEPSAPLMIAVAIILAGVSAVLIVTRQWPALAIWLTYLISP